MKERYFALAVFAAAVAALALMPAVTRADDASADIPPSTQEQLDAMDKGADTVDVSSYPAVQQDNYQVFAAKCSKCHTLARPINSPYALPSEWQAYVTKMRHKPRSGIDDDSAQQIIDFLTYDSSIRKKDIIAKKLADPKAAAVTSSTAPAGGAPANPPAPAAH